MSDIRHVNDGEREKRLATLPFAEAVEAERAYTRGEWGDVDDDNHDAGDWSRLLLLYGGRFAEEMERGFGLERWEEDSEEFLRSARVRLIKIAALCNATVDSIDRAIVRLT